MTSSPPEHTWAARVEAPRWSISSAARRATADADERRDGDAPRTVAVPRRPAACRRRRPRPVGIDGMSPYQRGARDSSSDFQTPDRRSRRRRRRSGSVRSVPVRNRVLARGFISALLERHNRQQPLRGLSSLSLGDEALNLDNFAIVCKIGEGSFGKVVSQGRRTTAPCTP